MQATAERPAIAGFEDFRLGQVFVGGERLVTAEDLARFAEVGGDHHPLHTDDAIARSKGYEGAILQGPFGLAAFFGWFYGTGVAREELVGLLDTNWRYLAPIYVGDQISFAMTITSCRRTTAGDRGVLGRHVQVRNQHGVVVQEGDTAVLLAAGPGTPRVGQELFSHDWAKVMAERLNSHAEFRAGTATWDGSIGIGDERAEVEFRVYRGQVIEAGSRTPSGPTFGVSASALTWAELVSGTTNDFMRRVMKGAFSVRGAAYEYLRLMRALNALVDCARTLANEERH